MIKQSMAKSLLTKDNRTNTSGNLLKVCFLGKK